MVKKAKKAAPTKEDIQRKQMILEYNRNNTETQILSKKVKEEDIKELEDQLKAIQDKHANITYLIADVNNAERVYTFLNNWNRSFIWTKDLWKGVVKFNTYLDDWYTKYKTEPCALEFDFAAMSFAYNLLMNASGIGLDAALEMEKMADEYDAILATLNTYVEEFQKDNERFKLLQDCLAARYQGFMMVLTDECASNEQNCNETVTQKDPVEDVCVSDNTDCLSVE